MRDRLAEFPSDLSVVVVTFSAPDYVRNYVETHQPGFPVLSDPTKDSYRAYGLERGSVLRVWGWRAALSYARILKQKRPGLRLATPVEDTLQLGGDFIVDQQGNLEYGFWGEGPDDRPSVAELVEVFERPD